MKHFFKFSVVALAAMTAGLLNSCTKNDSLAPDGTAPVINLLKAPDVIAYSGSNVWGSTLSTRTANVNGNMWYQDWDRPTNVTEEEIAKVLEAVKEPRPNVKNDITIEWENFWVQQVYKGQTSYSDHYDNNRGLGSDLMNELSVWNDKKEVWWPVQGYGGYEYVNNFNSGDNQTPYTDGENGYEYKGTTLMTDIAGGNAENQFAYKNSADGGQLYFDYIVVEIDGSYYVCFDFFANNRDNPTATANKDHYIDRDWVFNDWIVKISPAYHVGETPKKPEGGNTGSETPGENCENCGHPSHGDTCGECKEGEECYKPSETNPETPETPETPDQPGDKTGDDNGHHDHFDEVEVNLAAEKKDDGSIDAHLSIHVRAATDVEIFIPLEWENFVQKDDMAIVQKHIEEQMIHVHGGPKKVEYNIAGNPVTLFVEYESKGIRVWTEGINEEVINYCRDNYGDGITFEVWTYFFIEDEEENQEPFFTDVEELEDWLNKATIKFLGKEPKYYINAFGKAGWQDNNKRDGNVYDCTVSIDGDQVNHYTEGKKGPHLNGSDDNVIYTKK